MLMIQMVSELTIEIPIVNTMITEWNGIERIDLMLDIHSYLRNKIS